jgi:hypothetical protein
MLKEHVYMADKLFSWKVKHAESPKSGVEFPEAFCDVLQNAKNV